MDRRNFLWTALVSLTASGCRNRPSSIIPVDMDTRIRNAITYQKERMLSRCLNEYKMNIGNIPDTLHATYFKLAITEHTPEICAALIEGGIKASAVDGYGDNALHVAAKQLRRWQNIVQEPRHPAASHDGALVESYKEIVDIIRQSMDEQSLRATNRDGLTPDDILTAEHPNLLIDLPATLERFPVK